MVNTGLYAKDFTGTEVSFPKGNKNSAHFILDGAIFDDTTWFDHHADFYTNHNQTALDWLRNHIIAVIEK